MFPSGGLVFLGGVSVILCGSLCVLVAVVICFAHVSPRSHLGNSCFWAVFLWLSVCVSRCCDLLCPFFSTFPSGNLVFLGGVSVVLCGCLCVLVAACCCCGLLCSFFSTFPFGDLVFLGGVPVVVCVFKSLL